jgi:nucleoside-diphosphate-sugar epimerase
MALAIENEVWGLARFTNGAARSALERSGVVCRPVDLMYPDLAELPRDFSYILNFSVTRTGDWDTDLDANGGAIALLMEHASDSKALLHCSTIGVYEPAANHFFCEEDPLGDNHRVWAATMPFLSTYSISKIAAETVVRYASRRWNIPTTIGRLSVPYGNNGGWPSLHLDMMLSGTAIEVHPHRPNRFNPIHEDDIIASIPPLLVGSGDPSDRRELGRSGKLDRRVVRDPW